MGIAQVGNWTSAQFSASTGGSLAGRTSTAGNFIAITALSTDPAFTITHSQAGAVQIARTDSFLGGALKIAYIENIVGGASHTITLTAAAASNSFMNATEYSGVAISGSLDKTNVGTGTSTALLSAATAATTQSDELLIGGGANSDASSSAWTAGASFNLRGNLANGTTGACGFLEDRIVATTGTYTSSATWSGASSGWICQIATFKAAPDDRVVISIHRPGLEWPGNRPQPIQNYNVSTGASVTLAGQSDGSSTATAAMTLAENLAATSAGSSTTTAAMTLAESLAGSSAGSSTATAAMTLAETLAATSVGASTATAAMAMSLTLAASSVGSSTATAAMTVTKNLAGQSDGSSTASASLTLAETLAGTSAGVATATAAMTLAETLAGTSAGSSTATASMSVAIVLAGSSSGLSTAIAAMTVTNGSGPTVPFGPQLGSAEFYGKTVNETWNDAAYRYWSAFVP